MRVSRRVTSKQSQQRTAGQERHFLSFLQDLTRKSCATRVRRATSSLGFFHLSPSHPRLTASSFQQPIILATRSLSVQRHSSRADRRPRLRPLRPGVRLALALRRDLEREGAAASCSAYPPAADLGEVEVICESGMILEDLLAGEVDGVTAPA